MITVIIFRLLLLVAIGIIIYSIGKYLFDPRRKLEAAHSQGTFHFLDDPNNVRKNLLFTYRGVLFEGEKFLGPTEDSFEVTSILIGTEEVDKLQGLSIKDFHFLEKEILIHYPKAEIEWKSPMKELIKKQKKNHEY
ncbi:MULTISPECIES: sigma-w pathway protein ysdB [Bacillaceae]|uniref:Sigma-w pathway protein ysdB n=1 Tax=Evansella alkalicola TaxID=745819 RepID=A0ABS6JSG4_9BACI|nr:MULTISPECIES: sigma-w pathway protein ysdB [Bacillaceae]MBU9721177.1 sigma-w pathway protein ysdB [Bacillus alkalicola]